MIKSKQRLDILKAYRDYLIAGISATEARNKLTAQFQVDRRTINKIIEEETQNEREAILEDTIRRVEAGDGIDWPKFARISLQKFCEVLWDGRKIHGNEKWAIEVVFRKIDKENNKPDDSREIPI